MFGFCRDPFTERLHEHGFSLVPLADSSIKPLMVLGRQGKELYRLGAIDELFEAASGAPTPTIQGDLEVQGLDVSTTSSLDAGLGTSLVIGKWLGGKDANLKGRIRRSAKFHLAFGGLRRDATKLAEIDGFLKVARLKFEMPMIEQLLVQDDVYVTISTLKAISMSLESDGERLLEGDAAVPEIGGVASGSVNVSYDAKAGSKLVFESSAPVVFAFQAVQLRFDNGRYKTLTVERSGLKLMGVNGLATAAAAAETGYLCDRIGPGFANFSGAS